MAAGKAVVSTAVGADGLADTPAAFACAVWDVLANNEHAAELGRAARALVETRYQW